MQYKIVIIGPTSTGKTSLSMELCKIFDGEIISADSRQIFKYMDIGTGKVPVTPGVAVTRSNQVWNINGINIWGYDLAKPGQYFSAYNYADFALNKITQSHKNIFLAGGTGFYIDVVTGRLKVARSKPNFKLRNHLETLSLAELQDLLPAKILSKIDKQNPARLIRAIEKESSDKTNKFPAIPRLKKTDFKYIGLTAPREVLYKKTDEWLEKVWNEGLLGELKFLIKKGYENTPQLNGLIYNTAKSFTKGLLGEEEAKQKAKFDLHAYIRRQQTWFKRNPNIVWFDITQSDYRKKIADHVKLILDG
jgi:tRNA dimethylallyltransferase